MITMLQQQLYKFFRSELDFRVRVFNLLAMVGAVISLLMAAASFQSTGGSPMTVFKLSLSILSFHLLYYSYTSGHYQRCYLATISVIFLFGFGLLFFHDGGYRSALPSFFIFSIVFTVFMLEGRLMVATASLELFFYVVLCVYAYYMPAQVNWFASEREVATDIVMGFVSVSIALGTAMYFTFRMYSRQQRQLEEAREEAVRASEAKSMFLAKMSHEIRTPIHIMLGMNEMVMREAPTAAIANYIGRSQEAGQILLALTNDILDVSKIESGKMELQEEIYFTGDLLQELIGLGQELSKAKNLIFSSEIAAVPTLLWGDRRHIRQIIANFLSNAIKYTQTGSVKLIVAISANPGDDGILLSISVQDTGIGIRQENIANIFDAFTRSQTARSLTVEGTGLGLAIVKELTTLMGGRLSVRSEYGIGSTFTVEIPQQIAEESPTLSHTPIASQVEQSFLAPQGRILVIDDNEGNLNVIRCLLARTLLQIDTALGGRQGIELACQNRYHVILLDYMMPTPDGIETLHELRRLNCLSPIVALTADVTARTRQKLIDEGFSAYLAKPIPWTRLEQTMLSFLPANIVTRIAVNDIPQCQYASVDLQRALALCGISLQTALSFLGRNLSQYKTAAGLFYAHTDKLPELLPQLLEPGALPELRRMVHSLKALARIVGAEELSAIALRIEEKCSHGNIEYARAAVPLLLYELKTVREGIGRHLITNDFLSMDAAPNVASPDTNVSGLLSRIAAHIADYRHAESCQDLTVLIALEQNPDTHQMLADIYKAVDDLNFDEAEELFRQFREQRSKEEPALEFLQ